MAAQEDCLNQGKVQLFCLARAMLKKTKILLLDEATSSLDAKSDLIKQDVIREEFSSCTINAIAYRLEAIRSLDRDADLDHGKLCVFGQSGLYPDITQCFRDIGVNARGIPVTLSHGGLSSVFTAVVTLTQLRHAEATTIVDNGFVQISDRV